MRLFGVCEQFLQDLRYALRMIARQPLFAAMAVLSLALGIGANTAIYSFMDAILLRALPVRDPDSLVVLNWRSKDRPAVVHSLNGSNFRDPKTGYTSGNFPFPAYEHLRANSPLFSSIFAFKEAGRLNLLIRGRADLANSQFVSGEYFGALGVPPAAGRLIDSADDRAGAPPVVVLGFRYAQRFFGDIPGALGQAILINNVPFTVAGVAPPEFFGVDPGGPQDLYLPMHTSLLLDPPSQGNPNRKYIESTYYWSDMMGRLRPGVSMAQAQAAIAPVFRQYVEGTAVNDKERADLPALYLQEGAGGLDFLRRRYSRPLYVLMAMVALILVIACANIANLLLARSTARRREMALRLSLGAARLRLVRQLLTESTLLAALGGLLGVAFASWGIRALTLLIGNGREGFTLHANLNWRVLAVTIALSFVTGLLFGLAPAVQSTRVDLNAALRQTRAGEPRLRWGAWFRVSPNQVLVVSQIAISLLLLVAAGLFVRTLNNLNSISLGFNGERVLLFSVNARQAGYQNDGLVRFYDDLQARLALIPGVRDVTLSNFALVSGSLNMTGVTLPGFTGKNPGTSSLNVGPGFFTTMQIPILLGREVDQRDVRRGAAVAVVNEVFARTYFSGENPIGRHFGLGGSAPVDLEIIGVSRTARYHTLKQDIPPVAYIPYSQSIRNLGQMTYEVRAAGEPHSLAGAVRQAVQQADARVPVSNVGTQAERIGQTISQERTFATLCSCFAVLAVLIACVGLYGTMAYSVARRTNEIGLRMALGAERPGVVWMVLREVLVMAAVGMGIGLPVALAASRVLENFLFQMKPNDPLALAAAAATLLAAAVLAGYGPARRASRVDPWTALRDE
jgi:macrolide transport system ATP-binding/permease protein